VSRIYFVPASPQATGNTWELQEGEALRVDDLAGVDADLVHPPKGLEIGRADLEALADRLGAGRSKHRREISARIRKALAGDAFANQGNRDNAAFELACELAETWPEADAMSVASHFATALGKQGHPTVEAFAAKILRMQEKLAEERAEKERETREGLAGRISDAFGGERMHPYSDDELATFAAGAGCTRAEFQRRWLIQSGKTYYIFRGGDYLQPVTDADVQIAAERDLAAASSAGVSVWQVDDKGNVVLKPTKVLMAQYGTVARGIEIDLSAQRGHYDAGRQVIVEAPCPLRPFEPREWPDIDYWLRLLGGDQAEPLLDWVSVVTALSEPCAVLYLSGAPGVGKSLLADGLARLYTDGPPTPLGEAMGSFNEMVTQCPIVLADEVMPEVFRKAGSTGELRQLVQARRHALRRKYRATGTLIGCMRLVLCANNRHMLDTEEHLSDHDIEAIVDRVLYIQAGGQAREALRALGHEQIREWATRGIAEHAMWLRANRVVERGSRFLVTGRDSSLHRTLTTSTGIRAAIMNWCAAYLLEPAKVDTQRDLLIRVDGGKLLVTARGLMNHWDQYRTNAFAPTAARLSSALAGLSNGRVELQAGARGVAYHQIDGQNLRAWCEETGFASWEELHVGLLRSTPSKGLQIVPAPEPSAEPELEPVLEGEPF
jgi:hypothetical protein